MKDIDALILEFLNNRITRDDFNYLSHWSKASDENRNYVRTRIELWFSASVASDNTSFNSRKAFEHFMKKVESVDAPTDERALSSATEVAIDSKPFFFGSKTKWIATAVAAIMLLALLPLTGYKLGESSVQKQFSNIVVTAPAGSTLEISLPDSSLVSLNAGSTLTYTQGFGIIDRKVTLRGEGYFKIHHNDNNPFVVNSSMMDITDIGTTFRVSNYDDEPIAELSLVEGKVRVENLIEHFQVSDLKPGQSLQLDKRTGTVRKIDSAEGDDASRMGRLHFNETTLEDIAKKLSRQYGRKVVVASSLKNMEFVGDFDTQSQTIEEVLDILGETQRLRYTKKNNTYYIY